MQWFAEAPSNIALIKYMGKKDANSNIPMNPSLSYTLHHLLSSVTLETHPGHQDKWEPLSLPNALDFKLSTTGQERFLRHLKHLKAYMNYSGSFVVRSRNNFPHGSGLASSASSFAALTQCALKAISELTHVPLPSLETQAHLSRVGSGSSCRSFFSPWALWGEQTVKAIDLPYKDLIHQVIIISHDEKKVSSSEAHRRIATSPLFATRAQQAEAHLKTLFHAFDAHDWASAYQVCWQEFQDMHQLFSTCSTPFSYINDQSQAALNTLQSLWDQSGDGPLITMDAGPNIHLLYRPDQAEMADKIKQDHFIGL